MVEVCSIFYLKYLVVYLISYFLPKLDAKKSSESASMQGNRRLQRFYPDQDTREVAENPILAIAKRMGSFSASILQAGLI